ncbi:MAG: phage tail tape measure protein [Pseudomonadota bacterium]
MRELKLKYIIDLASNLGAKARSEAQAVEQAQRSMQSSVDRTSGAVMRLDSAYARFAANNATERQVGYMRRLAQSIDTVQGKMRGLAALTAKGIQNGPAAIAGATGAFYAAKTMLDKPMDYDMRLRGVTATAFAGKDINALRAGKSEINQLVLDAVRQAKGATRDATLMAFEKLVGSGSLSLDESKALLPKIMKTSVASMSDANDLVQASEKMKVTFGLTPDQIEVGLAKLMRGGQEGGFEIKDSAKWIGPLAPFFKGYKGMAGVEAMVTMLQQVRSTAGTNDEAANNLRNFVQKMSSASTVKDFKKQGIDLTAEMAKGAVRGETPVDTYMAQLDKVMAKQDPEGKARAAMKAVDSDKSLSDEERAARYARVAEIYKTAGISSIINDLQEMGGYSGLAGTKAYGKKVLASVQSENGNAVKTGYEFMSEGTGAKAKALGNEVDNAVSNAFEGKSGFLNSMLDGASKLAQEFPLLTTAAVGAGSALAALAAFGGIFSLLASRFAGGLPGLGGPGGGLPGAGGAPGAFPVLEGAAGAAGYSVAGAIGAAGGVLAGGAALSYGAANMLANNKGMRDAMQYDIGGDGALAAAILGANEPANRPDNHRGKGYNDPRLLSLTTPSVADQAMVLGQTAKIELGEGKLAVDVTLRDERTSVSTSLTTPMSNVKVSAGATNPEGTW